jgi:outer membrane receptor protein involved in Fe transport
MAHNYLVNQQFTQELRLTSDFSGPFNFMTGGFYQDQVMKSHPILQANTFVGLPASIGNTRHVIPIKSVSVFGQVLYKITPQLELSAGGRWTHEKRTHREFNYLASNGPIGGEIPRFDGKISPSNFSPEISLTYTPTDEFTIFGNYKQGFKSGSFNAVSFVSATTPAAFNDEKVEGGELGIKSRWLDRHLSLNLAGYYTKYSGIQVGASERSSTGAVLSKTINAEGAKIYGLELEAVFTPENVEGLTLTSGINYNHARYGRFPNAPCGGGQTISEGCNQLLNTATGRFTAQDLSGRPLSRAPAWTGNVGFDYEHPVFNDMTLAVGSALNFSSSYYTNILDFDTTGYKQKGYAKINMNIALRGPNEAWEVALIGNNVTNKYTAGYCFNSNVQGVSFFGGVQSGLPTKGPAGDEEPDCIVDRGRSVMLRVTVRPLDFLKN